MARHTPNRPRRHLVERTHSVDIRTLKRNGQIAPGETAILVCFNGRSDRIRLVHLDRPVFGGFRTHFCCPGCDRRCDLLYARPNFACRRCHRLAFTSENESRSYRALRQLLKRRHRLGQTEGGVIPPFPGKPKWWRWPRYLRTRSEGKQHEREYWQCLGQSIMDGNYLRKGRPNSTRRSRDPRRKVM